MTILETIKANAATFPDRAATIRNGVTTTYAQLATRLVDVASRRFMSSGTTGTIKRINLTDAQLQSRLARLNAAWADINIAVISAENLTPAHWMRINFLWLKGGTVIQSVSNDPVEWAYLGKTHSADTLFYWPPRADRRDVDLTGYRFPLIHVAGAPVSVTDLGALRTFGEQLFFHYGASEIGPIACGSYEEINWHEGCVGKLLPGLEVQFDADGSIGLKGAGIATGFEDQNNTHITAFRNGACYTGDTGFLDAATGTLVLTGRSST